MDLWIIRALLFVAILVSGYFIRPFGTGVTNLQLTLIFSACLGLIIILVEMRLRKLSPKTLIGAAIGSILGIIGASLISLVVGRMSFESETQTFIQLLILMHTVYHFNFSILCHCVLPGKLQSRFGNIGSIVTY